MMNLSVSIDGWVLGDGNYDDFRAAERRQFALMFYALTPLGKVDPAPKRFIPQDGYGYHIVAEVVFASSDCCVLDFGALAYSENASDIQAQYVVGEFVEGDVTFCVDPFFYFERLAKTEGVPPLIYEWHIDSIEQETTPWILSKACGRDVHIRDEKRLQLQSVRGTDVNIPRDVSPSYVLHCTKLDTEPSKILERDLPYRVFVVVDRDYGQGLAELAQRGPVWIVDTPANRPVAAQIWAAEPKRSHLEGVTTFKFREGSSPEDILVDELHTIDDHHGTSSANPPYTIVEVIGTGISDRIKDELGEFGFDQFEPTPQGFRAIRPLPKD